MKKSKLLIAPLLVAPFLASCGGGSEEYKVSILDTNGVIVTPNKATKGKDYVGTIKIATDIIDDQLLPDKLDKVTSGNKELVATKDYTYTLKEDNLSADFKIPAANIVGDVSIQLTLKEAVDYTVTKEEFDKALGFEGITYLQMGSYGELPGVFTSDVINKYSPTVYYSKSVVSSPAGENYTEMYVYKISDSVYKSVNRGSSTDPGGDWVDVGADLWQTPGNVGQNLLGILDSLGFEFDPTKFDAETKTYVIPVDDGAGGTADLIFKFENKKIIYFDLGGNGEYTYSYDEVTPELPIPAPTL